MPRDGAHTRQRLIDVGRALFATKGVFATPLKAIVDGSGQRNASALHYHFGSRQGLLDAIIDATNEGIEVRRLTLLERYGEKPSLEELVDAWISPQAELLDDAEGRQFLSIISQLNDLFDEWTNETMPPTALRTLSAIGERLVHLADPLVRRERLNRFLELTAEALGSRARLIDRVSRPALSHEAWVTNLAQMCVGALSATAAAPARR
jgi:AcrR family transcriptional regulator